jgi:hypothetical protein
VYAGSAYESVCFFVALNFNIKNHLIQFHFKASREEQFTFMPQIDKLFFPDQ